MSLQGARMRMTHDLGRFLSSGRNHPNPEVRRMIEPCAVPEGMNLGDLAICCGLFRSVGVEGVAALIKAVHDKVAAAEALAPKPKKTSFYKRSANVKVDLDEEEAALYYLHGKAWR